MFKTKEYLNLARNHIFDFCVPTNSVEEPFLELQELVFCLYFTLAYKNF